MTSMGNKGISSHVDVYLLQTVRWQNTRYKATRRLLFCRFFYCDVTGTLLILTRQNNNCNAIKRLGFFGRVCLSPYGLQWDTKLPFQSNINFYDREYACRVIKKSLRHWGSQKLQISWGLVDRQYEWKCVCESNYFVHVQCALKHESIL